jgi:hypothetical protein
MKDMSPVHHSLRLGVTSQIVERFALSRGRMRQTTLSVLGSSEDCSVAGWPTLPGQFGHAGWSRAPQVLSRLWRRWSNQTLEPTATARLARVRLGFEFASSAFELALPVAVAQLFR